MSYLWGCTAEQKGSYETNLGQVFFFNLGELGNLRLRKGCCCSLLWKLGCWSFLADFPVEGDFPGNLGEIREVGCSLGRSCGDKQKCLEAVRRWLVGKSEAERLLCDRWPRHF